MRLGSIAKLVGNFVKDNSPTILTVIGVGGTVSTAVLAVRATPAALRAMEDAYEAKVQDGLQPPTKVEYFVTTWKFYIPAVAVGGATIACIIGANTISSKRTTAIASAFAVTETAFRDYKDHVVEQIGTTQEQKVRDKIAQDEVTNNPASTAEIIITGNGDVLCRDAYSGRYFESNMEFLRKVENDLNYELLNGDGEVALNEFYHRIGLSGIGQGDDVGWNSEKNIALKYSGTLTEDKRPCMVVTFEQQPFPKYYRVW